MSNLAKYVLFTSSRKKIKLLIDHLPSYFSASIILFSNIISILTRAIPFCMLVNPVWPQLNILCVLYRISPRMLLLKYIHWVHTWIFTKNMECMRKTAAKLWYATLRRGYILLHEWTKWTGSRWKKATLLRCTE